MPVCRPRTLVVPAVLLVAVGLSAPPAQAAPTLSATVDRHASTAPLGAAVVTGAFTCAGDDYVEWRVTLTQKVGRSTVTGDGFSFADAICAATPLDWGVHVDPDSGAFRPGRAFAVTEVRACKDSVCTFVNSERFVHIKK